MKRFLLIFLTLSALLCTAYARRRFIPKQPSGGSAPAFGAVLGRSATYVSTATNVITVGSTAAVGSRVVVAICYRAPSDTLSTLVDSGGNTYTQDAAFTGASGFGQLYIYSSVLGTALTSGVGTITATSTTGNTEVRYVAAFTITGSTAVDVTASGEDSSGTTHVESATASTTAATVAIGICWWNVSETYTPGTGWTLDAASSAGYPSAYYQTYASSGSKTTGGSWATNARWASIWVAYK